MATGRSNTPMLLVLIGLAVAYAGWSGDGLSLLGVEGIKTRMAHVKGMQDTMAIYQAKIDTAKKELAKESLDDLTKRVEAYKGSLALLRTLVPEQREVPNLLDDITARARAHAISVQVFSPVPSAVGPAPFDTYSYNMTVIGRYDNLGKFLTDIASLRRIMVPTDLSLTPAKIEVARQLGDTTAMLVATFTVRTYVKSKASAEDAKHAP